MLLFASARYDISELGMIDAIWDLDDEPEGNVQHIAEHGISKEDVEAVLADPVDE